MAHKRAGIPSKRKGTEDKHETLQLEAEVSLGRIMKQDVVIISLIITSTVDVARMDISWQVNVVIKREGEVTDP